MVFLSVLEGVSAYRWDYSVALEYPSLKYSFAYDCVEPHNLLTPEFYLHSICIRKILVKQKYFSRLRK